LPDIAVGRPQVVGERQLAARARAGQRKADRLLEHLANVDRALRGLAAARKRQELTSQALRPERDALEIGQPRKDGIAARARHLGEGDVVEQGGQNVVEVVSDAAREQTNRVELLGVEQVSVEDARAAGGTHDEELSLGTPALVREMDRDLTNTLPGTIAGDDRPFDGAMRFSGQGRAWVGPCALDASQHRGDRLARGIGRRPAGQRLGGAVERDDPTAGVYNDDTVLDGAAYGLE